MLSNHDKARLMRAFHKHRRRFERFRRAHNYASTWKVEWIPLAPALLALAEKHWAKLSRIAPHCGYRFEEAPPGPASGTVIAPTAGQTFDPAQFRWNTAPGRWISMGSPRQEKPKPRRPNRRTREKRRRK